jgi:hypothetical protein
MEDGYWDKFTEVHSESTVAFVKGILGKPLSYDEFMREITVACPHKKRRVAKNLFKFLVKFDWITDASAQE